jgi:hypothetical protein
MYSTEAAQCKEKENLFMIMNTGYIKQMRAEVQLHRYSFYYIYWNLSTRYKVKNFVTCQQLIENILLVTFLPLTQKEITAADYEFILIY